MLLFLVIGSFLNPMPLHTSSSHSPFHHALQKLREPSFASTEDDTLNITIRHVARTFSVSWIIPRCKQILSCLFCMLLYKFAFVYRPVSSLAMMLFVLTAGACERLWALSTTPFWFIIPFFEGEGEAQEESKYKENKWMMDGQRETARFR